MSVKQAFAAALLACAVLLAGCASPSGPTKSGDAAPPSAASFVSKDSGAAASKQDIEATTSPLPNPTGYVNDFAKVLDAGAKARLEEKLARLKERAKIELAVATVETTGGRDIDEYSLAVARGWGVGPKAGEEGGGLLLLLAVKDRKWHIQVSRSLEAALPDEKVAELGGVMTLPLREGKHAEAVNKCVDALIETLAERRGFKDK